MSAYRLLNYESGDTVATGLNRPKTTALLFDKLWIPSDFRHSEFGHSLEYDRIPRRVCIVEEIEESIRINRSIHQIRKALLSGKKMSEIPFDEKDWDGLKIMPYVGQNRPFYTVEEDVLGLDFMFSAGRNLGLKNAVSSFKKIYGIEIVPIFIGHTAFEESILAHDDEMLAFQLQRYHHNKMINMAFNFDRFPIPNLSEFEEKTTCNAWEVCINNMPTIVEEKLKWRQVLEVRKDESSVKKIRRLRNWINSELNGKTRSEIAELLGQAIDDYIFALKKHGIMTTVGGITTVLSSSASIAEALSGEFAVQLSAGLVVSAGLITYTASQLSDFFENKRAPVAFIYEIQQQTTLPKGKTKRSGRFLK